MATTSLVNKELSFHSIQLLTHFSTKQHIDCLQFESMNAASYNDLFSKGLLVFVKGNGLGLYLQTSNAGKQLIGADGN
jgi:hypothetical protein